MSGLNGSAPPGLPVALDLDEMHGVIQTALREAGAHDALETLIAMDIRLRSDKPSWILYRAKLRGTDGRAHRRLLSARLARPGDASEVPGPALLEGYEREDGWIPRPVMELPALQMTLFPYPLDAALPGLLQASSEDAMRRELDRLWGHRRLRVKSVRVRSMGYTPHARAAFDYEVLAEWRRSGEPLVRRLIGKMHSNKPAARLFADSWAVWQAAGGRVGLAAPVGFIGPAGLTLQERVPGERLGGLVDQPGFRNAVRRTARALAHFHGLQVPVGGRRKLTEEVRGVERWAGILRTIRADLTPRVDALRTELLAQVEARMKMSATVHADFHHSNVLVDGERVTIIDLDEMAFGDPMLDVGRFLASLRVPARRAFGDVTALNDAGESFLSEYMARAGELADAGRARLFEAVALLTAAGSSFRIQRQGWPEEVELLLDEAERALEASRTRSMVGGGSRAASDQVQPTLPALPWADDPTYMRAALHPLVRDAYGADLTRCRPKRRSVGSGDDRFHYLLDGYEGDEPWSGDVEAFHRKRGGKGFLERLSRVRDAIAADPAAPVLPRPIGHLRNLALVVWDVPSGVAVSGIEDPSALLAVAPRIGEALACFHASGVELEQRRSLADELVRIERGLAARWAGSELGDRAEELLSAVGRMLSAVLRLSGPTIRIVHPRHLVVDGDRIGLRRVEDVAAGHPWLDLADVSVRLTRMGLQKGWAGQMEAVVEAVRWAYAERTPDDGPGPEGLAPFEALAALRILSSQERSHETESELRPLLGYASGNLPLSSIAYEVPS